MIKSFTGLIHSKYLGIHLDKYLTWKHQINVAINLHKANAILSKIRPYIDMKTFYTIYYGIFESRLSYASLVWVQNLSFVKRLHILQKK